MKVAVFVSFLDNIGRVPVKVPFRHGMMTLTSGMGCGGGRWFFNVLLFPDGVFRENLI
ncbi:MAG: hypothetical protein ACLFO2_03170 [Candidatus Woesearchaeota archaeon]